MADLSAQQIPDLGNLLSSFPRNQANIANTEANTAFTAGPQTQNTQAQTGLVQQQTQKAAFEVQMIKQAMEAMKNIPSGQSEQSGEAVADPTETGIASTLNKKMFVDKMGPPGLQQYINAAAWVNPAEAQRAEEWRKTAVEAATSRNQNEANDIFQTSTSLANSNAGLDTLLKTTHPGSYLNNVGKAISAMQGKTPEEKDALARSAIQAAAKYSHQYTGREVTIEGDEVRDKTTQFPVAAPKVGPTPGEQIDIGKWRNTPQTVTIDNREATIKPKDLGIKNYQDLTNNKSIKFSVPPPGSSQATTHNQSGVRPSNPVVPPVAGSTPSPPAVGGGQGAPATPAPTSPMTPEQVRNTPSSQGGPSIPGFSKEQSDFIKEQPPGYPQIPGNQKLNPDDKNQRDIYRKQAEDLSKVTNTENNKTQETLTHIKQINNLLASPGLTLGPGSHEFSQLETVLNQWFDTPAGQAGAYQVLTKVLNAEQMNGVLAKFHDEGAQVRLGAYESRLIMEKLAANPNLTKAAIQQMLQWQASDAQYGMNKIRTASALLQTGRSIANFDTLYGSKFPKQDIVDTSLSALAPKGGPKFENAKGKTYTPAQVSEAAAAAGIPRVMFEEKLTKAGGIIK